MALILRKQLLETLRQRFGSQVDLGVLQVRYDHGLLVQGRDLKVVSVLHGVAGNTAKPMLQVKHFAFRTSLISLLRPTPHLHDVKVDGILLEMPPVASQKSRDTASRQVALDAIAFDDVRAIFASDDPKRAPLVFDFPHGVLSGIRPGKPFRFDVAVDNGPPIGVTDTSGTIGPWNFDDPRQTPVTGQLTFAGKDISSVPGLHGQLSIRLAYKGTFAQMRAEGTSDDPAFGLDVSSHTVALHTRFALLLDAVSSVTRLESAEADFLHTHFVYSGNVTKSRSYPGYNFDLSLNVPKGRIEDALALGSSTIPPILRGTFTLQGPMQMQAGQEPVSARLQITSAGFHVKDAMFSNAETQQEVEEMSERAQGHPHDANEHKASASPIQADGRLSLKAAVLYLDQVHLTLPGAQANVAGQYALKNSRFRIDGTVHTDAKASQMTTGFKSLIAKPFNALFSRGHEGATLPLSMHGSGGTAAFDVILPGGKRIAAPAEHH